MVLELKIPHSAEWADLKPLIPTILSYLMSFIYIGIYWGNHHHLLHSLKSVTSGIIWANMNLLFWLSLIPFATGWMGENDFAPNTMLLYGILLLLCGVSFTILQKAVQQHTQDIQALKAAFKNLNKKAIISTVAYTLGVLTAYKAPLAAGAIFFIVAIMYLIPDKHIEKALEQKEGQE